MYDDLNRLTNEQRVGFADKVYTYNAIELESVTDCEGRVINYTYYDNGQTHTEERRSVTNTVENLIHYEYDANGNLTEVSDYNSTYRYYYDGNGQVRSVSTVVGDLLDDPAGFVTNYAGELTDDDAVNSSGYHFDAYPVWMNSGDSLTIDLESGEFDAYLKLLAPDGTVSATNDNGGGGTDAQIVKTADQTGWWLVEASPASQDSGAYTLTLHGGAAGFSLVTHMTSTASSRRLSTTRADE